MTKRSLFIGTSIVSLITLSLLTLLTVEYAADTAPLGAKEVFVIESDTPDLTLTNDIADYASRTKTKLALGVLDKEGGMWKRHLYMFGDTENGYANTYDFGRYTRSVVHSFDDEPDVNPVGTWFIFDSTDIESVYEFLDSKNIAYHVVASIDYPQITGLPMPLFSLLAILIVLNIGVAIVDVISRQRYYALSFLHGHNSVSVWGRDILPIVFVWGIGLVAVVLCISIVFYMCVSWLSYRFLFSKLLYYGSLFFYQYSQVISLCLFLCNVRVS